MRAVEIVLVHRALTQVLGHSAVVTAGDAADVAHITPAVGVIVMVVLMEIVASS